MSSNEKIVKDVFETIKELKEQKTPPPPSKGKKPPPPNKVTTKDTQKEVDTPKITKGEKAGSYNDVNTCRSCNILKNNISGSTGSCYECDGPDKKEEEEKEVKQDDTTIEKVVTKEMADEAEKEVAEVEEKTPPPPPRPPAPPPTAVKKKSIVPSKKKTPPSPPVDKKDDKKKEVKPKTPVIKPEKKDEIIKSGPITEAKLRKILGQDGVQFDDAFETEELVEKQTITVVGKAKSGKTTLVFSAERGMFDRDFRPDPSKCDHDSPTIGCEFCRPTIFYAITMDDKTFKPAKKYRKKGKIIHVLRGMEHMKEQSDTLLLMTSELTIHWLLDIITNQIPKHCKKNYGIDQPDFFFLDDLDIFQRVAEHAMRSSFDFGVYDKFDWKHWTRRNQYVNDFHRKAQLLPKEALFYATYEKWEDKKTESGEEVSIKKPKWAGDIEKKTDTLIESIALEGETMTFLAQVKSAKDIYWSYTKEKATVDYEGHGGLWNILSNAPDGKRYDIGEKNV